MIISILWSMILLVYKIILTRAVLRSCMLEIILKGLNLWLNSQIAAQPNRSQALIDNRGIENLESLETNIPARINKSQPVTIIIFVEENKFICVDWTLKVDLKKTMDILSFETRLFITIRKPFKDIWSQSLGHWTKNLP